jgi:LysM repeat protein
LANSTIGIKVADGSYYPILEHGFTGRKRLTLTTVKDNQDKMQIDLYRGNGSGLDEAHYIGSLTIENIPPAPQGEPEIELLIGIDAAGQLSAQAGDARTGEVEKFATSLTTLSAEDTYDEPEFEIELEEEERPLTGETYPVSEEDRRKSSTGRKGPNVLLLVLFVVLGVALVVAIAYFIYRSIQGPQISVPVVSKPAATATQPAPQPAATQPAAQPAATEATAAQPGPAQQTASASSAVTYRIKRGDTLWDISSTYYRNPWLYPKLAKANSIKNPDLIFAGTHITIPEN